MNAGDTSLGGWGRAFPATTQGLLSRLGRDPRAALEEVCRRYWKPVYAYLRIARARSNEDAKDLTQAFVLWLLEGDALSSYAAERGSLRGFLKVLLSRFVEHEDRARQALKRGGGRKLLRLDDEESPLRDVLADGQARDPGEVFDRAWRDELAKVVVERVRRRLESEGRGAQFRIYEAYHLGNSSYDDLAKSLGISESEVRHGLSAAREAVRQELRVELSKYTLGPGDLQEEMHVLFGS